MESTKDIFSRDEERFDEVFERVLSVARESDRDADVEVYCECADCRECEGESHICGNTLFYTSKLQRKDETATRHIKEVFHLYTSDQERVIFEIRLYSRDPEAGDFLSSIRSPIIREMSRISSNKLTRLRDAVVESSLLSTDVASFCYRALRKMQLISEFEGGSIFVQEPKSEKLELAATTGIRKIVNRDLLKKDVFYFKDGKSYTSLCFRAGEPVFESDRNGLRENTFGESIGKVLNRTYFPIQLRKTSATASSLGDERVGVLRIVNIRKNGLVQPPSKHDAYLFGFFCEFVCILSRLYQKASNPFGVLERATHGFIHDLSILSGRVGMFDKTTIDPFLNAIQNFQANSDASSTEATRFSAWLRRFTDEYELFKSDMLGVVESMAAQLHSVLDTTDFSAGRIVGPKDHTVAQPYREVFVRLEKAAPFIARSHNKTSPTVFYRTPPPDSDFRFMPSLSIDPEVFYLAMRNFLENSIKYQHDSPSPPRAEVVWWEDGDSVVFEFSDDGIGIHNEEEKYLFRTGFRGREAILRSTRGNGIGLAFSKQAIEAFGGNVEYSGTGLAGKGCKFTVTVKRAKS